MNAFIGQLSHAIPDRLYLKLRYRWHLHKKLNLKHPLTYNEKIQWLKLYDRRPEYPVMADKYEAKKFAARIIGKEHIIPVYGLWNQFDEIDFDKLPRQFVLKCTHDSGGVVIVTDRSAMDMEAVKKKINDCLKSNYFYYGREWPYKKIRPRILAEKLLHHNGSSVFEDIPDYKFFCFDGVCRLMFVASDRQSETEETKFDFFDRQFQHLEIRNGHPNADRQIKKPQHFEEMMEYAEKLSRGIPQLRVDFYEVNGRVYFGEMTLFHWSGFVPFVPNTWDTLLGSWITLPEKRRDGRKKRI